MPTLCPRSVRLYPALALTSAIALVGCFDPSSDDNGDETVDNEAPEQPVDDNPEDGFGSPDIGAQQISARATSSFDEQDWRCDVSGLTVMAHDSNGTLVHTKENAEAGVIDISEIPDDGYVGFALEDGNHSISMAHLAKEIIKEHHELDFTNLPEQLVSNCEKNKGVETIALDITNEGDFEIVEKLNMDDRSAVAALGRENASFNTFDEYAFEGDVSQRTQPIELTIDQQPRAIGVVKQRDADEVTRIRSDAILVEKEQGRVETLGPLEDRHEQLSKFNTLHEASATYITTTTQIAREDEVDPTVRRSGWIDNEVSAIDVGAIEPTDLSGIVLKDNSFDFTFNPSHNDLESRQNQLTAFYLGEGVLQNVIYPHGQIEDGSAPLLEIPAQFERDSLVPPAVQVRVDSYTSFDHQNYLMPVGAGATLLMNEDAYSERHGDSDEPFTRAIYPEVIQFVGGDTRG